jgi:hypothetical protein
VAKNFIDSDFIKVKYLFKPSEARKAELQRTYDRLIERAKDRVYDRRVHENHHIIPSSLGGTDDSSNIAVLTYDEHYLAHWLLIRLTTGYARILMLYALYFMSLAGRKHSSRCVSGWQYSLARLAQSEAAKLRYEQPGVRDAHSALMKVVNNTEKALQNKREAQRRRFSRPGALEAHKAAMNNRKITKNRRQRPRHPDTIEANRQAMLKYFSQPGALEAHKAAHNTASALENQRQAQRMAKGRPVENVTLGLVFRSVPDAIDYFGKKSGDIKSCCRQYQKTAGGYVWRYITKEEYEARKDKQDAART